jgi:very-short-patch-repair endonuclease
MHKPPVPTITHERATALRRGYTDAERKLWMHLRAGRLNGLKFRRQHPVPPYIVDFVCVSLALVVEVDGSQHAPEVDAARSRFLESQGLSILRFWDHDVLIHTNELLVEILEFAENRTLSPTPLPEGEGLKSDAP